MCEGNCSKQQQKAAEPPPGKGLKSRTLWLTVATVFSPLAIASGFVLLDKMPAELWASHAQFLVGAGLLVWGGVNVAKKGIGAALAASQSKAPPKQ